MKGSRVNSSLLWIPDSLGRLPTLTPPAYKLPPEANLMAVGHYMDNLRHQVHAAQLTAIWGAKKPHLQGHLPGGVTVIQQLNADRISDYLFRLREQIKFIEEVYIPDLLAVAGFYKDWTKIGGNSNFLSLMAILRRDGIRNQESYISSEEIIFNKELKKEAKRRYLEDHRGREASLVRRSKPLQPSEGETKPLTGEKLKGAVPDTQSKDGKYPWMKAPRYNGLAMEVGPLAECLVSYVGGNKEIKETTDMVLKKLEVGPEALFSTLGRMARVAEHV